MPRAQNNNDQQYEQEPEVHFQCRPDGVSAHLWVAFLVHLCNLPCLVQPPLRTCTNPRWVVDRGVGALHEHAGDWAPASAPWGTSGMAKDSHQKANRKTFAKLTNVVFKHGKSLKKLPCSAAGLLVGSMLAVDGHCETSVAILAQAPEPFLGWTSLQHFNNTICIIIWD